MSREIYDAAHKTTHSERCCSDVARPDEEVRSTTPSKWTSGLTGTKQNQKCFPYRRSIREVNLSVHANVHSDRMSNRSAIDNVRQDGYSVRGAVNLAETNRGNGDDQVSVGIKFTYKENMCHIRHFLYVCVFVRFCAYGFASQRTCVSCLHICACVFVSVSK